MSIGIKLARFSRAAGAALALGAALAAMAGPARAADPDEAELLKYYDKVDVWHFPVDYAVRYNNQDVIITRELVAQPPAQGELCHIRFDLIHAEGDYGYGLKPAALGGVRKDTEWGVYVHKRGTVLNQMFSSLKMNVIYFYVDGLKQDAPKDVCARLRAAATPQAGNAFKGEWSDLVVRARLIHGWPPKAPH